MESLEGDQFHELDSVTDQLMYTIFRHSDKKSKQSVFVLTC